MAKNWCKDYPDVDLTPYEYLTYKNEDCETFDYEEGLIALQKELDKGIVVENHYQ